MQSHLHERFIFLKILTISIFLFSPSAHAEWKLIAFGGGARWDYDPQKVTYRTDKLVDVWIRGRGDTIKKLSFESYGSSVEGFWERWSYSLTLYQINCKERLVASISTTDYNHSGIPLGSSVDTKPPYNFVYITPDSLMDMASSTICKSKK
jgi:hypothetical protein